MTPQWRKSSRSSDGTSSQCVEVARLNSVIGLRDSKDPGMGNLVLSAEAFAGLVDSAKRDELDLT